MLIDINYIAAAAMINMILLVIGQIDINRQIREMYANAYR